jgi:hypothetical protein
MLAAKKKKQPPLDMGGELLRFRALVDAFIDGKIEEIKSSRDGANLPRETIRAMIVRGGSCPCKSVAELLGQQ